MTLNGTAIVAKLKNLRFAEHCPVLHPRSGTVINVLDDIVKGIQDDLIGSITTLRICDGQFTILRINCESGVTLR